MLSKEERSVFLSLFCRNGYVLNFNDSEFNNFTAASVGVAVKDCYNPLSKGRALKQFVQEHPDERADRLLFALFEYYREHYRIEYESTSICSPEMDYSMNYDPRLRSCYTRCLELYEREKAPSAHVAESAAYLEGEFSYSNYMGKQIGRMLEARVRRPTEAIGLSKDLVESCCKTILGEQGVPIEKSWDTSQLVKQTTKLLDLSAESDAGTGRLSEITKQIVGSLHGLSTGIIELRNAYGDGHGRDASFQEAPVRHAKLAVGSSITLVEYLWETYEWRISQGRLKAPANRPQA